MRSLLLILPLLLIRCLGATTTVTAMTIETNGWQALVWFASLQTNSSTYAFGNLNTSNWTYSTYPITIDLTRMGFDDNGNAETHTLRVHGTRTVRFNYPGDAFVDEQIKNSTNLQVRFSLDHYISSQDSNLVASMPAGVITQNGTNNLAISGLSVTNNSTVTYSQFPVIGNWSAVPFVVIQSNPMVLRCVAFHQSAVDWNLGRPVRGVTFSVADQHSHTTNITINYMSISNDWSDWVPVPEYICRVDTGPFTDGDQLTCNFKAFPFDGDSTSVLDTSTIGAGGTQLPTTWPCPRTNRLDISGSYGQCVVVVDATNGNDSTGAGCTLAAFPGTPGTTWKPFATIAHAYTNLSNLHKANFGRSNVCNGLVYVTNGTYAWMGANPISGYGSAPTEWAYITTYPGVARSAVTIGSASGIQGVANHMICLRNLTITCTTGNMIRTSTYGWIDGCDVNETGIGLVHDIKAYWATRNQVESWKPGIAADAGTSAYPILTRANDLALVSTSGTAYEIHTVLGNRRSTTNLIDLAFSPYITGANYPCGPHAIIAYNDLRGFAQNASTPVAMAQVAQTNSIGCARVQNIVESWQNLTDSKFGSQMAADASTGTPVNNFISWYDVVVGSKYNGPYNEVTNTLCFRDYYSVVGCNWDDGNLKGDQFANPTIDGGRIGNWGPTWGVGYFGNFFGNVNGIGTAAFTHNEEGGMPGVDSVENFSSGGTGQSFPANYQQFVNRQSFDGSSQQAGFGNYRMLSSSPLVTNTVNRWVIPFDFEGANRSMIDLPGAYAAGQPRKGSGFF